MSDPFDMVALVELVLTQGLPGIRIVSSFISQDFSSLFATLFVETRFRTDPNDPAVEKLNITAPTEAWLEEKYKPLPLLHPDAGSLVYVRHDTRIHSFLLY